MQFLKYRMQRGTVPVLALFMAGLFAGFLMIQIGKGTLLQSTGLLDEDTLYQMKYMTVDSNALFWYVLRQRMGSVLVLAVLATTYLGFVVCMGTAFWYGMSAGAFLAVLLARYGLKGVFFVLAGIFPQYLLYVPALYALLVWCEEIYRSIYGKNHINLQGDVAAFISGRALKLLLIAAAFLMGCFLESYVNPQVMGGLLKIF